jgi:5-deoxy-glucuronate isomerase
VWYRLRMAHAAHITKNREGFPWGTTVVTEATDGHGIELAIVRMKKGESITEHSGMETAWVLLDGRCMTSVDGIEHPVERHSLFDERPSVVQLPPREHITLRAETDVEWARVRTENFRSFDPALYVPESITSEARGKGLVQDASLRIVRLVFDDNNAPASNLVIGEVINLAGKWSSYPPHHHDQPELYHYRFTHPQGYGHAEIGDDVVKVKQNDTVKITGGLDHPQVAAPGYGMYYLWIVRHGEKRYTGFTFTNEHRWILDGKDQGWVAKELK